MIVNGYEEKIKHLEKKCEWICGQWDEQKKCIVGRDVNYRVRAQPSFVYYKPSPILTQPYYNQGLGLVPGLTHLIEKNISFIFVLKF